MDGFEALFREHVFLVSPSWLKDNRLPLRAQARELRALRLGAPRLYVDYLPVSDAFSTSTSLCLAAANCLGNKLPHCAG